MTKGKNRMSDVTVAQLVADFAAMAVEQSRALDFDDYDKYNTLYEEMNNVEEELRSRGAKARLALTGLFDHPNRQVRYAAATATLAVAPTAARHTLESIVAEKWFPQAGYAGMTLAHLDDGTFKPT
jgi:hypothetical protein